MRLVGAVLLYAAALASPIAAQQVAPLPAGTRAWIYGSRVPDRGLKGTLLGQRQDSVVFQPDGKGQTLVLPLRTIRRVLVSTRRPGNTLTGLAVGGLIGGATGAVITLGGGNTSEDLPVGFALGAGAGLLLGAMLGSAIHSDHWKLRLEPLQVEPMVAREASR